VTAPVVLVSGAGGGIGADVAIDQGYSAGK